MLLLCSYKHQLHYRRLFTACGNFLLHIRARKREKFSHKNFAWFNTFALLFGFSFLFFWMVKGRVFRLESRSFVGWGGWLRKNFNVFPHQHKRRGRWERKYSFFLCCRFSQIVNRFFFIFFSDGGNLICRFRHRLLFISHPQWTWLWALIVQVKFTLSISQISFFTNQHDSTQSAGRAGLNWYHKLNAHTPRVLRLFLGWCCVENIY